MHVSLSALESALRFVEDLADTDDPAHLGRRALSSSFWNWSRWAAPTPR